jgi:hypothetical protein
VHDDPGPAPIATGRSGSGHVRYPGGREARVPAPARAAFAPTLNVSLIADESVMPGMLTEYLIRAMSLNIDYDRQGMGPVPNSLVFLDVHTDRLVPAG